MGDVPKEASKLVMGIVFIIAAIVGFGISGVFNVGSRIAKLIDNFTPVSTIKWVPPVIGIGVYVSIAVLAYSKLTGHARAGAIGFTAGATLSELTTL